MQQTPSGSRTPFRMARRQAAATHGALVCRNCQRLSRASCCRTLSQTLMSTGSVTASRIRGRNLAGTIESVGP